MSHDLDQHSKGRSARRSAPLGTNCIKQWTGDVFVDTLLDGSWDDGDDDGDGDGDGGDDDDPQ